VKGAAARLGFAALAAQAGCHKASTESTPAGVDGSAEAASGPATRPAVLPARCRPTGRALAIDPSGDVEIGDAQPFPAGTAVAMVHRTAAGRVTALAMSPPGLPRLRVVDLAPTLGDAPPPRLAWRGKDLLAADYVLPSKASGSRELAVWAIDPALFTADRPAAEARVPEPLARIPQQRGDSLSFDLAYTDVRADAAALVVWDEATGGASPRGVIRSSLVRGEGAEPARDVSPTDSDAEMARVLPGGSGFFVLWLARRPETGTAPSGESVGGPASAEKAANGPSTRGQELEVTGEPRAFAWLEMVALDAHGTPSGPVRRLTPTTGHVSTYDAMVLAREPKATLLIVARDDGEAVDGSGGALLRVRAGGDFADAPLELPTDGLGRGAPSLVEASPPWLTWVDQREQLRLLPMDPSGAPAGGSSTEEALGEARPLLGLDAEQMLLARPRTPHLTDLELAVVTCPR
jgi:hypothetical protein